jgi:hypothetical protein
MVTITIQTDDERYAGTLYLTLDRVPCVGEAVNVLGGFMLVTHVVHVPYDHPTPPNAVVKTTFHPVIRSV